MLEPRDLSAPRLEAPGTGAGPRILVVGASENAVCGVRDHARILAAELELQGARTRTAWWERHRGEHRDDWLASVDAAAAAFAPDWLLWHYSVFTYGDRGLPHDVPRIARRLAAAGPLALFLHETALRLDGRHWRRVVQAASQQAVLRTVLAAAATGFVTVPERARRLAASRWLPGRPLAFVPVFSNLPPTPRVPPVPGSLGVLGFAHALPLACECTAALARLRAEGRDCRLVLLGSPGLSSDAAERWRRAAAANACSAQLAFTGVLEPDDLATALAGVEIVLFADDSGPTSRKGTLAAALAAGKPVVATDGPRAWSDLAAAGCLVLAPPTAVGLAAALAQLLDDGARRDALGARATAFSDERLAPARAAAAVLAGLGTGHAVARAA